MGEREGVFMEEKGKCGRTFWKNVLLKSVSFIRKNAGQMLYYGGVALVLCAFAFAAQQLRVKRNPDAAETAMPIAEIDVAETIQAEETVFLLPETAQIVGGYSALPQWQSELGCWQCHPGMDVSFEDDLARSVAEGRVAAIGENGSYGGFVEVETAEFLLRYASIEPIKDIEVGDELEAGECIGRVNSSMPGETSSGAHMHFEMMKDGAHVDPAQWIENAN